VTNKHNQSKNEPKAATVTEEAPAVVTEVNAPAVAAVVEPAPPELAGEVVNEVAPPPAATGPRVFSVEIPLCLLGVRTFVAESADDAYWQYRKLGGINGHARQQIVNELPEGSPGYVEAIAAATGA